MCTEMNTQGTYRFDSGHGLVWTTSTTVETERDSSGKSIGSACG